MTSKEGVIYTYPANGSARPHAVTATSDGKTYLYDNNGNMTTDGTRAIAYDYDNMPSSVTMGATTTSFVYDASGQRVKKITPTTTTVYVGKLYECTNGSCTKYIMANGNKLAWKNSAGTFYYHQDHLGSSRVITDSTGTKAEELTYLPYGATLTDSGNGTVSVEHRFTSQEFDAETGLYYYGARYYNPGLGRFISADSIVPDPEDPQAFNRYSYTLNNPVIYTDPTGNASEGYWTAFLSFGVSDKYSYSSADRSSSSGFNSSDTGPSSWFWGSSGSSYGGGGGKRQSAPAQKQPAGPSAPAGSSGATVVGTSSCHVAQANTITTYGLVIGLPRDVGNILLDTLYSYSDDVIWGRISGSFSAIGDGNFAVPVLTALQYATGGKFKGLENSIAHSAKEAVNLRRHLGYIEKYGQDGVKELSNGRLRYYGALEVASKPGEMAGRRYVHEFDPATGRSRGWHEVLDHSGSIRQVRPELNNGNLWGTFIKL